MGHIVENTPKELNKIALEVNDVLLRGIRKECKEYGFSYDNDTNNALYLLSVGEVLRIDSEIFPPIWARRYEDRFCFVQGEIDDKTYSIWGSNTRFPAYKKKEE